MQMALLHEAVATHQDYEWYPTTDEIINAVAEHLFSTGSKRSSLLDVGAGDGKVLKALANKAAERGHSYMELFAIEKSRPLLDCLDSEIAIVGTDFWEQTLVDKKVDVIFSNPPYSEFGLWSEKLIREANAGKVYLVIPSRWKDNVHIQEALTARQAQVKVLGSFDFLNAEDRTARAKVDLVYVDLRFYNSKFEYFNDEALMVDPFELWASEHYNLKNGSMADDKLSDHHKTQKIKEEFGVKLDRQMVAGKNLIEAMHELYMADMNKLIKIYQDVSEMDPDLMRELDVSVSSLLKSLRLRIKGLKDLYWSQLFDHYEPIISRLTQKSRSNMLSTLRERTNIDFTPSNAYAVTIWAIKNANQYFDRQLIKLFEEMLERANIVNYKSNQRVFGKNDYRYSHYEFLKQVSHVKLEYRIVCEYIGGICTEFGKERRSGLRQSAFDFLGDVLTVAHNLGFTKEDSVTRHFFNAGQKEVFSYYDSRTGKSKTLMEVRAFMNGNIHIRFASEFMLALNVEVGRLKGWIHSAQQAAEEMGEELASVERVFKSAYQLLPASGAEIMLLGHQVN